MRASRVALAIAAVLAASPASADDAADIRALEEAWGRAFLANDYNTVARIVAPEFKLMRAENGKAEFTSRAQWLANAQRLTFHQYEIKVTDVTVSGRTAVATIEGHWKISRADRGTRDERFLVSDTWTKRNGRWSVVFRHSSPAPAIR